MVFVESSGGGSVGFGEGGCEDSDEGLKEDEGEDGETHLEFEIGWKRNEMVMELSADWMSWRGIACRQRIMNHNASSPRSIIEDKSQLTVPCQVVKCLAP